MVNRIIKWIIILLVLSALTGHLSAMLDSNSQRTIRAVLSDYPISAKIKRNATGNLVGVDGVSSLMMDWLSLRLKSGFHVLDLKNVTTVEDAGTNQPGFTTYLLKGECDVIVGPIGRTPNRIRIFDYIQPWFRTDFGLLIPMTEELPNNIDAIIKPFHFWVWTGLILSALTVFVILICFNRIPINRSSNQGRLTQNQFNYILATLLNQGSYMATKVLTVRLVIGSWCILTLVFFNVYNGTLISYVTAKHRSDPLVQSANDVIGNYSQIYLLVDKGQGPEQAFVTAAGGVNKILGDKIRSYDKSRCSSVRDCIELLKSIPHRHSYLSGEFTLNEAIRSDYVKTGQCQLQKAKNVVLHPAVFVGWVVAKGNPIAKQFNHGFLMMQDFGLINYWIDRYQPDIGVCLDAAGDKTKKKSKKEKTKPLTRLTLGNLSGAFILLIVGSLISLLMFIFEIGHHLITNSRNTK